MLAHVRDDIVHLLRQIPARDGVSMTHDIAHMVSVIYHTCQCSAQQRYEDPSQSSSVYHARGAQPSCQRISVGLPGVQMRCGV